jgi:hypothetical protein
MVHLGNKGEALRLAKAGANKLSLMDNPTKADALVLVKQGVKKLGRRVKMRGNRVVGRGSNPIDDFIKGFRFDGKGINTIGEEAYGKGVSGLRENEGIGDMFQRMRQEKKDAEAAKEAEYNRQTKQNLDDWFSGKYGNGFILDEALMGLYKGGKKAIEKGKEYEAEKAVKAEAFKKRMAEIDKNSPFPKNPEMEKLLGYGFLDDIQGGLESAANWADDNINPFAAIARHYGGDIQSALRYGRGKGGGRRATHRMPDGSIMSEHRKHILEGRGITEMLFPKLKPPKPYLPQKEIAGNGIFDNLPKYDAEPPFDWIAKERCDAMGECDGRYKRGRNAFADILGEGM